MSNHDSPGRSITRRALLAQTARGAVLVSVAPYLGQAQALMPQQSFASRSRESFDFGWKFLHGDPPDAQAIRFAEQTGAMSISPTTGASKDRSTRPRPAVGLELICPRESAGTARAFIFLNRTVTKSSRSSLTAFTRTAWFGSMGISSAIVHTVTSPSLTN